VPLKETIGKQKRVPRPRCEYRNAKQKLKCKNLKNTQEIKKATFEGGFFV